MGKAVFDDSVSGVKVCPHVQHHGEVAGRSDECPVIEGLPGQQYGRRDACREV